MAHAHPSVLTNDRPLSEDGIQFVLLSNYMPIMAAESASETGDSPNNQPACASDTEGK